ncbi:hypothetical protein BKA93DRAFT_760086 [Sparassis latifolia]|uniref:Uncharacterized protein n=1 Tax=Sparassis crispa TaxID=139825 RepID=A0A401GMJ6_9APHY|nr:hypothetical protein SCP_0504830 [Sparassis crispa]GBE83435.1 hypothetical protein SCP_0504830 [Sparassis crispa]
MPGHTFHLSDREIALLLATLAPAALPPELQNFRNALQTYWSAVGAAGDAGGPSRSSSLPAPQLFSSMPVGMDEQGATVLDVAWVPPSSSIPPSGPGESAVEAKRKAETPPGSAKKPRFVASSSSSTNSSSTASSGSTANSSSTIDSAAAPTPRPQTVDNFITELAGCLAASASGIPYWATTCLSTFSSRAEVVHESLSSIVPLCSLRSGSRGFKEWFLNMVHMMQLTAKCESIMQQTGKSLLRIHREDLNSNAGSSKPTYSTFKRWHWLGSRYSAVAAGGSIYILVLIVGSNLRNHIIEMEEDVLQQVINVLRSPEKNDPAGKIVIDQIIPAVARLYVLRPLKLSCMFSIAILAQAELRWNASCTDLEASDKFFSAIASSKFTLASRASSAWEACRTEPDLPKTVESTEQTKSTSENASGRAASTSPPGWKIDDTFALPDVEGFKSDIFDLDLEFAPGSPTELIHGATEESSQVETNEIVASIEGSEEVDVNESV